MKHLFAMFASWFFGACAAAIVARVAFPHVAEGSLFAPPIIIFPVVSVSVSLPAYILAMMVSSARIKEPSEKKHPVWGVIVATSVTLMAAIAFAVFLKFKETNR